MPCYDGREQDSRCAEAARLDFLVKNLCLVCEYLVDKGEASKLPSELYAWYVEHKKWDKIRTDKKDR